MKIIKKWKLRQKIFPFEVPKKFRKSAKLIPFRHWGGDQIEGVRQKILFLYKPAPYPSPHNTNYNRFFGRKRKMFKIFAEKPKFLTNFQDFTHNFESKQI